MKSPAGKREKNVVKKKENKGRGGKIQGGCERRKVKTDKSTGKRRDERDGVKSDDLPHSFMDNCICIQTSQHASLFHSG